MSHTANATLIRNCPPSRQVLTCQQSAIHHGRHQLRCGGADRFWRDRRSHSGPVSQKPSTSLIEEWALSSHQGTLRKDAQGEPAKSKCLRERAPIFIVTLDLTDVIGDALANNRKPGCR